MSKTRVIIKANSPYGDYKKGDRGIVDGYCRGGSDVPCAVVIIGTMFVCVPVYVLLFDGYDEGVEFTG